MTHEAFLHILFENEIRWRSPDARRHGMRYTGSGENEADAVARWMTHILANQISYYYVRGVMSGLLGFSLRPHVVRRYWKNDDADPQENLDFILDGASLRSGLVISVRVNRVGALTNSPRLYEYVGYSGGDTYTAGGEHDMRTTDRYFIRTVMEEAGVRLG